MTWFQTLTGIRDESPDTVYRGLEVCGNRLKSRIHGGEWHFGTLETPSLRELRQRALETPARDAPTSWRQIVADVQDLHCDESNAGAMFQVASQFNLLEMASPRLTPESGVGIYENDPTQGPACAIAAGAGTIYRNYFVPVDGRTGQTHDNQIDCLAEVGQFLDNPTQHHWKMVNGYALPTRKGLAAVNERLENMDEAGRDELRSRLRIGVQYDTQVTLDGRTHRVTQAFCSALPVAYTRHPPVLWTPFAPLVLEAAYEATVCAAIDNAARTGNRRLFLTQLGGGAFGNETEWILGAIWRALSRYADCGLDIAIVSYGRPDPGIERLCEALKSQLRDTRQPDKNR